MRVVFVIFALTLCLLRPSLSDAVSMTNDPKGFHNIVWGSPLKVRTDLEPTRKGPTFVEYQFKNTPPTFANIPVESLRLSTVDDQFARVTIRYQGEETHKRILAYLETEFGRTEYL
ncbi:MAG TPA: hypothetical protein VF732_01645, partial [Nitrospira sp.]